MPISDSKIDGENDLPVQTDPDIYDGGANAANAGSGIGGTTSAAETFDRIGSAASEFDDAEEGAARRPLSKTIDGALADLDAVAADDSPLKWIVPLVLLVLLIVLGYWFCGKTTTAVSKTNGAVSIAKTIAA